MTALINLPRAAWRRQPQQAVVLSKNYRRATLAYLPTTCYYNLADNSRFTYLGGRSPVFGYSAQGAGMRSPSYSIISTNTGLLGKTINPASVNWPGITVIGVGVINTKNAQYNTVATLNSGTMGADGGWSLFARTYNGRTLVFYAGNSANAIALAGYQTENFLTLPINTTQSFVAIGRWNKNTIHLNAQLSVSGYFSVSNSHVYDWANASLTEKIGYYANNRSNDEFINCVVVLPYFIGDAETLELINNPWQLFAPAPSRFYLIPGSGGATTYDVALTLAYTAAFQPTATAQFNAGITLATLAGALSGKSVQFNTALTLDTNVSVTLQRALSALASVKLEMTAAQSVSALNDAVAAINESISCSYTSSVTANLLAGLSLAISQGLLASTGATLNEALTLALNAALTPSVQASYATQLSLLATLQTALTTALSTSATLTLPAIFTVTIDGEKLGNNDLALALHVQTGISTSATAILSAQLTLATQLLATPAGVGSFQTALTLANQLSALFTTGSELSSSLSLAVSLALADAAAISMGGALELGAVLSQVQSAIASFQAGLTFPTTLTAPITGGLAMEEGISLGWTLGTNLDGTFFEITVTLPTGRMVVITASERLISIQASERLVQLLPTNPFVQV